MRWYAFLPLGSTYVIQFFYLPSFAGFLSELWPLASLEVLFGGPGILYQCLHHPDVKKK